jgi:steroid delta-isomerase-like uncharacterized protein
VSTEENKAIVRRFGAELLNEMNFAAADEILAPDFAVHGIPGVPPSREGFEGAVRMFHAGFPDWEDRIEDMVAEGDRVAIRLTGSGTHSGDFMGIPPTGKRVTISGIAIYRLAGGKVAEDRVQLDLLGMLQQLGAIPAPGQAG